MPNTIIYFDFKKNEYIIPPADKLNYNKLNKLELYTILEIIN